MPCSKLDGQKCFEDLKDKSLQKKFKEVLEKLKELRSKR